MLHIYLRAGLREEAEDLFVEMLESGIRANVVTYATMIDGLASSGEAPDALMAMQLFWQARSEGLLPFASFISRQPDGAILVDLHGMSALTSVIAVEFALAIKEGSFIAKERALAGKDAQMVLVTGRGLHSKGGAAVVRPAVESFLKEHGIGFSTAADNEGRLVIERLSSSLPLVVFCSLLLVFTHASYSLRVDAVAVAAAVALAVAALYSAGRAILCGCLSEASCYALRVRCQHTTHTS